MFIYNSNQVQRDLFYSSQVEESKRMDVREKKEKLTEIELA